jgi:N utilization substance protein A
MEVPEIEDGIIDIASIARNPGERAKIIVRSNDKRIDPVGACVGMRGSRIQAIVRELNNEKIDIVNFSEQAEILDCRALSPAKPVQLFIDDDKKYCVALFEDENLDAAIGRNGMNINLASKITDYRIDAYGVKQYERIQEDQKTMLSDIDGVPPKAAKSLEKVGINIVSELLDADMDNLLSTKGVTEDLLDEIYEAVQSFVERELEIEDVEELDLSVLDQDDNNDSKSEENESDDSLNDTEEAPAKKIDANDESDTSQDEKEVISDDKPVTEKAE